MQDEVARLLRPRTGHFRLESGHHGDLWLDLESLCLHPESVRRLAGRLAAHLVPHGVEVVCGPLIEGAFVALLAAAELGVRFTYSERWVDPHATGIFPARYRLPGTLRDEVRGRRVAIVNDVINAGSALRGTLADLAACGATPVAIGTLAVLGGMADALAAERRLPLEALERLPNRVWTPPECPLCGRGVPLDDPS